MGTKHVNDDKGRGFQSSKGRNDGSKPDKSHSSGRERNIGHKDSEEHSRTPKGNRG